MAKKKRVIKNNNKKKRTNLNDGGFDYASIAGKGLNAGADMIDPLLENGQVSKGGATAKGFMKGAGSTAGIGLNPLALGATGGLSALLPLLTGTIGAIKGNKDADGVNDKWNEANSAKAVNEFYNNRESFNAGGVVKGKGGIDNNKAELKKGSFVIPKEIANTKEIRDIAKVLGLNKALPKHNGTAPVNLTKEELVIPPNMIKDVEKMINAPIQTLAPNAKSGNDFKDGGFVIDEKTKQYTATKDQNINGTEIKKGWTIDEFGDVYNEKGLPQEVDNFTRANIRYEYEKTKDPKLFNTTKKRNAKLKEFGLQKARIDKFERNAPPKDIKEFQNLSKEEQAKFKGDTPNIEQELKDRKSEFDFLNDDLGSEDIDYGKDAQELNIDKALLADIQNNDVASQNDITDIDNQLADLESETEQGKAMAAADAFVDTEMKMQSNEDNLDTPTFGKKQNTSSGNPDDVKKNMEFGLTEGLAVGQMGMGLLTTLTNGKRPEREVPAELMAIADQAKQDAEFGISATERNLLEGAIEENFSETNAAVRSGSAQTQQAAKLMAGANKDKSASNIALINEKEKARKGLYSDSLQKDIASIKQKKYDDELTAFLDTEAAGANLLDAGVSNFVGSQEMRSMTDRMRKLEKMYT